MLTEVRVPNPKHEFISQVALTLPSPHRVFELPASAVLTDAKAVRIANGATIHIASGLKEGDQVVRLASAELVDGRAADIAQ